MQECIKLIKIDCKTSTLLQTFLFQTNAVLLSLLLIKVLKKRITISTKIKQHSCYQHHNKKKILSTKSAY